MKMVYNSREERAEYIWKKYGMFLPESVLDVGCGNAYLRKHITNNYAGVDFTGNPDIRIDLEQGELPFIDNSFYSVVCTDVLEHLENIHKIFWELIRVSKRYVIISLPNNWTPIFEYILTGKANLHYYGLPLEKPIDRHKWFFNYEDAINFIYGIAEKMDMDVLVCEPYHGPRGRTLKKILPAIATNSNKVNNVIAMALWAVLEKK
ncbi:MAG: class I SAM-dependent methyltransferase [Candidatus Omnitrophica bacterium]|nr:class I SAM-dependent methyltransferase [Candidatus Omnitrophota bacterium]